MVSFSVSTLLFTAGFAAAQVAVPPAGVAVPPAGVAVPPAGVEVPPAGVAVPGAGVVVPPAGQAVPPAGAAASSSVIPAAAAPPPVNPSGNDLVGTWSSKSNQTLTGPGFYDPVKEQFTEPKRTGISYSFTADGKFESAYYRAIANPAHPDCPKGIIQWQHGSYTKNANGSVTLEPIAVDGRQLYSDPCMSQNSVYTRWNTTELWDHYQVITDSYHLIPRLNIFEWDGAPKMPLYLALQTPKMLPTTTLNHLVTSTAGGAKATSKVKRSELPLNHKIVLKRAPQQQRADQWWWFGVFMTASGGVLYFFF